ncbi:MAG: MBL fold metallo-hydrolase, partial [Actinobacteria bacterium]|nr:MBL fold metallo-hydrolase [Actinomycetota bacterium]
CGFSKRETLARMERAKVDPSSIRAIIVTHEHSDHIAGLDVVSRALRVPVYASVGTVDSKKKIRDIQNVHSFRAREALEIAGIHIIAFPTSHDAADPIGMRFECGNDVIGYATDTGILSMESFEMLMNCRILALESNHDPDMLRTGPYPYPLKKRVASDIGHLSNAQSGIGLTKLLCDDLECVIGMHLSETNNLPALARDSLQTVVTRQDHPAHVAVAAQSRPISIL